LKARREEAGAGKKDVGRNEPEVILRIALKAWNIAVARGDVGAGFQSGEQTIEPRV
jgi:hypothetical protein